MKGSGGVEKNPSLWAHQSQAWLVKTCGCIFILNHPWGLLGSPTKVPGLCAIISEATQGSPWFLQVYLHAPPG